MENIEMTNKFKEYLTIKENELLDINGECILCEEDQCDEIYKGIRTSQYQDLYDNEYEVIIPWVFGVIGVDHRRQLYWIKIKH